MTDSTSGASGATSGSSGAADAANTASAADEAARQTETAIGASFDAEAAAAARAAANEATGCLMSQSQPIGPTHALSLDTINQLGAMPVHRSGEVASSAFSTYADVAMNTSTG